MTTPNYQKIKLIQLHQLAPELYDFFWANSIIDEEVEEDEYYEDMDLLYFNCDMHVDKFNYDKLKEEYGFYTPWVVNGNLVIEGEGFGGSALVKGDLVCDKFSHGEWVLVQGKIVVRHYATFIAEDHEMLCPTASLRLETPYVFAWFYSLQQVQLQPGTPVFIICDYSALKDMNLQEPYFYWKEWAFVLRPELSYTIESDYSDALHWDLKAIETALKKGEYLFINGFTTECMPLYRQAGNLLKEKNYPEAYRIAQQAALLSPGYYYPLYYMGYCLHQSSAFEQAIPLLQQAVRLFPEKHKNLQNQAADYLALAALRLRQLDMAIEWSSFSIESTRNNTQDNNYRWFPYRVRGEAYLLNGNLSAAQTDLEAAVNLNMGSASVNWLLGLVHYQLGKAREAAKHHGLTVNSDILFAANYDVHHNTDFLQVPATKVDWA